MIHKDEGKGEGVSRMRRRFLNILLVLSGLAIIRGIIYPVFKYLLPPENPGSIPGEVEAGPVSEVGPNSAKIFRFGTKPGILVHLPNGNFRAFSAVCTHLSCTVEYRPDYQDFYCPCHAGVYDLNGRNIGGPPPAPLEEYRVELRSEKVYVIKIVKET